MIKKLYLSILLILFAACVQAQKTGVSGKITSGNNSVSNATMTILNTNVSTVADGKGVFSFPDLPAGKYTVSVSAVGYASKTVTLILPSTNTIIIDLEQAENRLDEVTVTAQKREERLQVLPLSVSVVSARQVENYQLRTTGDITAIVPNLYSSDPGDNRNIASIRGIATTSYDPAVATYIDGVNQFSLDTYIAPLFDVERIEVLRGPQGTLYGRNAMGGVINIITKQPTNVTKGFAELEFGNYGQQRYSFGVRTPLIKDRLFLGIAGLYQKQTGFFTNQFNNSKFDKQSNLVGNYYLKYLAGSKLSFMLNVKHNENTNRGPFPLASSITDALANPFQLNQNALTKMKDNVLNSSLSINYSGRSFNFTSQTAYQTNRRIYKQPIDGDFSPIDGVTVLNDYGGDWNKVKALTHEIRFSSPGNMNANFKWVAGAYGYYQSNPARQGTHFGKDAGLVGSPITDFTSINTNKGKSSGVAFFGQATYSIAEKLDFSAGIRYDYEKRRLTVKGEFVQDGQASAVTRPDTSSSVNFNAFSPKASINYHISTNNHVYISYSKGFRTGGITQLSSDPSQPPLFGYEPEYSNNYEAGLKNTFLENKLRLNIALFKAKGTDAQVQTLILPDAIVVTKNAGKLNTQGVEFELRSTLVRGLETEFNAGFTNARYSDLKLASQGEAVSLVNNRQIFTPDITTLLALQYGFRLTKSGKVNFITGGEWKHIGDQYFDLANQFRQDAYDIFNARIGVTAKKYELFVWGRNIGNKRFIDYAYDFGAGHLGNPRTYGITLRANY